MQVIGTRVVRKAAGLRSGDGPLRDLCPSSFRAFIRHAAAFAVSLVRPRLLSADPRAGPGRSGTIGIVDAAPAPARRPGQPRSERDAALLERFDARMQLPIVVSAILPLVIVPESNGWVGVVVGVVTWLVFLVDYVVHARHLEHYGRTRLGRFDLFVVVATAPWFLFHGAQGGSSWSCSAWPVSPGW
jgi:hypothetical protein